MRRRGRRARPSALADVLGRLACDPAAAPLRAAAATAATRRAVGEHLAARLVEVRVDDPRRDLRVDDPRRDLRGDDPRRDLRGDEEPGAGDEPRWVVVVDSEETARELRRLRSELRASLAALPTPGVRPGRIEIAVEERSSAIVAGGVSSRSGDSAASQPPPPRRESPGPETEAALARIGDPETVARFRRLARALARIGPSPPASDAPRGRGSGGAVPRARKPADSDLPGWRR